MAEFFDDCLNLLDAEFDGKSWNGPSLMATLERLGAQEAASQKTWEGYSAWEIGIHCAQCKRLLAADLGAAVEPFPFTGEGYFNQPSDTSEAAWKRDLAYFRRAHKECMDALRAMKPASLDDIMPTWKHPYRQVIAWLCTHDAFHGAQIRSMGLPTLKEKKES